MKKTLPMLLLCSFLAGATHAGQASIVESDGSVCMGEDKSRKQTEQEAMAEAKKKAVENVSTHVRSETEVKNFQFEKDILSAFAHAEVKVLKEIEKGWYKDPSLGDCYRIRIKVEVIPDAAILERVYSTGGSGGAATAAHPERDELERMGIRYTAENFLKSVADNNIKIAELFIKAGIDVNMKTEGENDTALLLALGYKNAGLASKIVTAGANPNAQNRQRQLPLPTAAAFGLCGVVGQLIKAKADVAVQGPASLEAAASGGYTECVRMLFDAGVKPDTKQGLYGLERAAGRGSLEVVMLYLDRGINVQTVDLRGERVVDRMFKSAAYAGNIGMMEFLLKKGANKDMLDGGGNTVLMAAIKKKGRDEVVRLLLQAGADVNASNQNRETPLLLAVEENRLDYARDLLEAGAASGVMNSYGHTPITTAVRKRSPVMLQLLISRNANVNQRDREGKTALFHAVDTDQPNMVTILLEAKADPGIAEQYGTTPVILAIEKGKMDMVHTLAATKRGLNGVDRSNETAVRMAVRKQDADLLKTVLDAGAECSKPIGDGSTPLSRAAGAEWAEGVRLLVGHGCAMDAQDLQGDTALLSALKRGKWDIAKVLLEAKVDANVADSGDTTPLMWAAESRGGQDLIPLLVRNGAKLNAMDSDGEMALHRALRKNNREAVRALVESRADVNAANRDGETPLLIAVRKNDIEAVRLLMAAKADPRKAGHSGTSPLDFARSRKMADMIAAMEGKQK